MKIELKNTDFKVLCEWLESLSPPSIIGDCGKADCPELIKNIFDNQLKPQYDTAFLKYKDEEQKFEVRDRVEFIHHGDKESGKIVNVSRLANGKFRYKIKYKYISNVDEDGKEEYSYTTKHFTEKNIRKI